MNNMNMRLNINEVSLKYCFNYNQKRVLLIEENQNNYNICK